MKYHAYYNEIDPFAAEWLRQLIKENHIAPGVVDERSIEDVAPSDLYEFTQCHFFAGIGVWSYALRQAGWSDDRPVWTGSCPCQPFSAAGKGEGFNDERHLWPSWHWLISQCNPDIIFGEQVANGGGGPWLDLVSTDLEGTGYAFGAVDIPACGVGAPHIRQRSWFVAERLADAESIRSHEGSKNDERGVKRDSAQQRSIPIHSSDVSRLVDTSSKGLERRSIKPTRKEYQVVERDRDADWLHCRDGKYRPVESSTFPLAHGSPARVGRLRGYGNAINAEVAKEIIKIMLD